MTVKTAEEIESVVIRFAGDSGDGMQTVGEQFTDSSAISGNDIATFPDFPAEIRAPQGTLPGVSGFQIQLGQKEILTPGDAPNALVAMNPAALKVNLEELEPKGLLVLNSAAFTPDNLKKAGYAKNPLEDKTLSEKFQVISIDMTGLTKEALADSPLKAAQKTQCKNFFALGFMYWVYGRDLGYTLRWIEQKWKSKPDVVEANTKILKTGYYFGETTETMPTNYAIPQAKVEPGLYRKISGNEAFALGMATIAELAKKEVVYGSYPITPASSILEAMSRLKNFTIRTVQAEDEISAIGVALGASFAGELGVTGTSGPGICLKSEFIGLATITELPLIIINVQRGGPSTGLPTKTEQSDLLQAMYGRNGEGPIVVLAPQSPSDCYNIMLEAAQITLKYKTPVLILSDGSLANGSEPWKIPGQADMPQFVVEEATTGDEYIIYKRDPKTLARKLAFPGTPGLEHRIGGLEKNEAGEVSYDAQNHQNMVNLRAAKVEKVADCIPPLEIKGPKKGKVLVVGWGGTYGAITEAVGQLQKEGTQVSSLHLRHLNPLPVDLEGILRGFQKIIVPELNMGQLSFYLRGKYLVDALPYNKVQGRPFSVSELKIHIKEHL